MEPELPSMSPTTFSATRLALPVEHALNSTRCRMSNCDTARGSRIAMMPQTVTLFAKVYGTGQRYRSSGS